MFIKRGRFIIAGYFLTANKIEKLAVKLADEEKASKFYLLAAMQLAIRANKKIKK